MNLFFIWSILIAPVTSSPSPPPAPPPSPSLPPPMPPSPSPPPHLEDVSNTILYDGGDDAVWGTFTNDCSATFMEQGWYSFSRGEVAGDHKSQFSGCNIEFNEPDVSVVSGAGTGTGRSAAKTVNTFVDGRMLGVGLATSTAVPSLAKIWTFDGHLCWRVKGTPNSDGDDEGFRVLLVGHNWGTKSNKHYLGSEFKITSDYSTLSFPLREMAKYAAYAGEDTSKLGIFQAHEVFGVIVALSPDTATEGDFTYTDALWFGNCSDPSAALIGISIIEIELKSAEGITLENESSSANILHSWLAFCGLLTALLWT